MNIIMTATDQLTKKLPKDWGLIREITDAERLGLAKAGKSVGQ